MKDEMKRRALSPAVADLVSRYMATMSPVKVSLISTASGWLAACCIYIIHDVFRSVFWPQPPDDALDWIVTDLVIFVVAAPLAIIVWLLLWSAYAFAPVSSAFWHISLWVVCGWAIGCGLVYVFSPLFESSLPISPFNYASCAGAIAFGVAFFLRYTRTRSSDQAMQRTAR